VIFYSQLSRLKKLKLDSRNVEGHRHFQVTRKRTVSKEKVKESRPTEGTYLLISIGYILLYYPLMLIDMVHALIARLLR